MFDSVSLCELWLIFRMNVEFARNVCTLLGFNKQTKNGRSSNFRNAASETTQFEKLATLE
jgi:hypothetical protein